MLRYVARPTASTATSASATTTEVTTTSAAASDSPIYIEDCSSPPIRAASWVTAWHYHANLHICHGWTACAWTRLSGPAAAS
jgi:hypothetical protein